MDLLSTRLVSSRRSAFTLVELLVVIGIIAVLIAILLPSLKAARSTAQAVKCQSNLRTLGQFGQLYATENKGVIPHNGGNDNAGGRWWYLSRELWHQKTDFYDVEIQRQPGSNPSLADRAGDGALYCPLAGTLLQPRLFEGSFSDYALNRYLGGFRSNNDTNSVPRTSLLTAEKFWLGDTRVTLGTSGNSGPWWNTRSESMSAWTSRNNDVPWMLTETYDMEGHPGDKANFLYGDGHVGGLTFEELDDFRYEFTGPINQNTYLNRFSGFLDVP